MGKITASIDEDLFLIAKTGNKVYIQNGNKKIDTSKIITRSDGYTKDEVDDIIADIPSSGGDDDLSDYYDKTEVDYELSLKSDKDNTYTKSEVDTKIDEIIIGDTDLSGYYTKLDTDVRLNAKADKATTYTKTEVDNAIANIDIPEVDLTPYYTKTESDALLDTKADSSNVYTKSETYSQTKIDTSLAEKADKSETYSQTEIDNLISGSPDSTEVKIGLDAGATNQGERAVAIGNSAGSDKQGSDSVAIGYNAGKTDQGEGSIAIGYMAGKFSAPNNSILVGSSTSVSKATAAEMDSVVISSNGDTLGKTGVGAINIATNPLSPYNGVDLGNDEIALTTGTNQLKVTSDGLFINGEQLSAGGETESLPYVYRDLYRGAVSNLSKSDVLFATIMTKDGAINANTFITGRTNTPPSKAITVNVTLNGAAGKITFNTDGTITSSGKESHSYSNGDIMIILANSDLIASGIKDIIITAVL